MSIVVIGRNLPGARWCREDGSWMDNVHVGMQVLRDPTDLFRADALETRWHVGVDIIEKDGKVDFRGPAVHGKRGERFLYLTWVNVVGGRPEMFRRAKLMLHHIPAGLVHAASAGSRSLVAEVDLTDECGGPRCARVDAPHLTWSVAHD